MAANLTIQRSDQLKIASAATASGDVVLIGDSLVGVASTATDADGDISLHLSVALEGRSHSVTGADNVGNTAIALGDRLYLDTGVINADAVNGVPFGYALGTVGSGLTATINVLVGTL